MSAAKTSVEVLSMPRGQKIRTSRCETVQCFLEWHGLHAAEISGRYVTYRRDNLSGLFAASEPTVPPVVLAY